MSPEALEQTRKVLARGEVVLAQWRATCEFLDEREAARAEQQRLPTVDGVRPPAQEAQ